MRTMSTPVEFESSSHKASRRPSLPMIGIGVVTALLLVGAGVFIGRDGGDPSPAAANAANAGATVAPSDVSAVLGGFQYPAAWVPEALSGADQQVGIALKLQRTGPDGSFIARRLDGTLAQPFSMAALATSTEQGLQGAIKDFQLVETEQLRAGDQDYLRITYLQNQQPTAFTNQLVVVPTAARTFFLTFRSPATEWKNVQPEAEQMANNFLGAL